MDWTSALLITVAFFVTVAAIIFLPWYVTRRVTLPPQPPLNSEEFYSLLRHSRLERPSLWQYSQFYQTDENGKRERCALCSSDFRDGGRWQHDILTIGIHAMHKNCLERRKLIETFMFERYVLLKELLVTDLVAIVDDLIRRLCVAKFKLVTNDYLNYLAWCERYK